MVHRIIGRRGAKRPRSTAGKGTRLSGNIRYICLPAPLVFGGRPDPCKHLLGRLFCAGYIDLYDAKGKKVTDRQRRLGRDCLEIAVMSCRPMPLGFGPCLVRVGIYQGGSVSPDTSNYRTTMEKRTRSTAETGSRLSGNISYLLSPMPLGFGMFLIRVSIYQCGSVLPDTSNYRRPDGKIPIDSGNWIPTVWKCQLRLGAPFR